MIHRMLHAGLTGNIASGKSHAVSVFAELGAHIVDADVIARRLLNTETDTKLKVVNAFGPEILNAEGQINRKSLANIIFHDSAKRQLLNSLVHPDVRTVVLGQIVELEKQGTPGIIIVDAALLVESGFYRMYDKLIVVACDPAVQLARLISRDGISVEEARARIAAQLPAAEKVKLADYVIETSGTFKQTRGQIEEVYRKLVLDEIDQRLLPEA
jgi:dephospho-CoA kinase